MLCLVRRWGRYGTLLASMTEWNGDLPPAVTAFRPLCAERHQLILVKQVEGGLATFKLCLVFSVYRGSLGKSQGVLRKLKVTKSMGICAPVESTERVMALELDMLTSGEYYATSLSNCFLAVPYQDVICEVVWAKTGEKAGKLFFELHSDCKKVLADICEGKTNPLTVFLQKNVKLAAPSDTSEEFLGHQDLHLLRDLRVFGGEVVWPQTSTAKLCSTSWNGFLTFHSNFHVY